VAKEPGTAAQFNGFENDEKCSYLPTKTRGFAILIQPQLSPAMEWEGHVTTLAAHLPGNVSSARMTSALQVQTAR
jgi:hypothetical protein